MSDSARALVLYGAKMAEKGFVAATDGNLSARLPNSEGFLVTPTGVPKGELTKENLARLNPDGKVVSGAPSSEWPMHFAIYRAHPDVGAIVHAHPPFATALACANVAMDQPFLSEVVISLGHVPLVPFELPSTDKLANKVAAAMNGCQGALLANHGAVTAGPDVRTAYYRMETLEQAARVFLYARLLGGGRALPEEAISRLRELGRNYGLAPLPALACANCPVVSGEDGIYLKREELQRMLADFARLAGNGQFR